MSDKVEIEMIRQTAEALNKMTAELMARGFEVEIETAPGKDSVFVHIEREERKESRA